MATLKLPKSKDANLWEDPMTGKVTWDVRLRRPDGTTFRQNGVSDNKKDARKKRDAAFQEYNQSVGTVQSSLTIHQWGGTCLNEIWPSDIREKSHGNYEQMLRTHVFPILGDITLSEINTQQLQLFFNQLMESPLSRGSVIKVRTVLSSLLTRAVQFNHLRDNPIRYVRIKKDIEDEDEFLPDKRILTVEERCELLSFASATYIHTGTLLGMKMGLRPGECLGLQWPEVDFKKQSLRVRFQLQRIKGKGLVLLPLKTEAGYRTIKIPPSVLEVLKEEKSRSQSPFVMSNGIGKPLEPSRMRQVFGDCCWMAGLMSGKDAFGNLVPEPSFHDLRSTFLSYMANEKKVEPRTLMQIAGHSNIEVTLQYYVRSSDAHIANAMDLVD